jgi:hypothetical protein
MTWLSSRLESRDKNNKLFRYNCILNFQFGHIGDCTTAKSWNLPKQNKNALALETDDRVGAFPLLETSPIEKRHSELARSARSTEFKKVQRLKFKTH